MLSGWSQGIGRMVIFSMDSMVGRGSVVGCY